MSDDAALIAELREPRLGIDDRDDSEVMKSWDELFAQCEKATARIAVLTLDNTALVERCNNISDDAVTEIKEAEAERDEAVKRMERGWIQVCAEPAIKHFKEAADKAEAERDALMATATIANVGLKAAVARADKAEAESAALRDECAALREELIHARALKVCCGKFDTCAEPCAVLADALREQVAALNADAERYRWLRDVGPFRSFGLAVADSDGDIVAKAELDDAIDAARQPRAEGKP